MAIGTYKKISFLDNLSEFVFQTRNSFAVHATSTDEASCRQGPGNTIISREKLATNLEKEVEHTPPILLLLFPPAQEASSPYIENYRQECT